MKSFLKKCRKNGNAEAMYHNGILNYFRSGSDKRKGLEYLAKAGAKTHREAMYLHGMIFVCSGGGYEQKIFEVLSWLVKPSMSKTMRSLEECRDKIRSHIRHMWTDKTCRQLRNLYSCERCKYNGETTKFLVRNSIWNRYGENKDETCVCEACLWFHEVDRFFDILEKSCMF